MDDYYSNYDYTWDIPTQCAWQVPDPPWTPGVLVRCVAGRLEVLFSNAFPTASAYSLRLVDGTAVANETTVSGPHQRTYFSISPEKNYSVWIKPTDANNCELKRSWVASKLISCPVPPSPSTTGTIAPPPGTIANHSNPESEELMLIICVLLGLLFVLFSAMVIWICRRRHRRCCEKIRQATPTQTCRRVTVFPLYPWDNEMCASVVRQHMELLSKFGSVTVAAHDFPRQATRGNLQDWLGQQMQQITVLLYSSRWLTPDGSTTTRTDHHHSALEKQAVSKIKASSLRRGVIINLERTPCATTASDLFPRTLQLATLSPEGDVVLEDIQHLLQELHGGQAPQPAMADWASSPEAGKLRSGLQALWSTTTVDVGSLQSCNGNLPRQDQGPRMEPEGLSNFASEGSPFLQVNLHGGQVSGHGYSPVRTDHDASGCTTKRGGGRSGRKVTERGVDQLAAEQQALLSQHATPVSAEFRLETDSGTECSLTSVDAVE